MQHYHVFRRQTWNWCGTLIKQRGGHGGPHHQVWNGRLLEVKLSSGGSWCCFISVTCFCCFMHKTGSFLTRGNLLAANIYILYFKENLLFNLRATCDIKWVDLWEVWLCNRYEKSRIFTEEVWKKSPSYPSRDLQSAHFKLHLLAPNAQTTEHLISRFSCQKSRFIFFLCSGQWLHQRALQSTSPAVSLASDPLLHSEAGGG